MKEKINKYIADIKNIKISSVEDYNEFTKIYLSKKFYINLIQQNDNFFARKQEKKC